MPSVLIGLPLEERHHTVDRGGGCFGVDTQVDPPILLPPFTSGRAIGRDLPTSARHPHSLLVSHPVGWASQRWAPRSSHPPRWLGSAEREGGRSILAVYINTSISASLLFLIETDERTTWAISPPLTGHPSYAIPP